MRKQVLAIIAILALVVAASGFRCTLTRKGQDVYEMAAGGIVETNGCYVYAYYEESYINTDESEVYFLQSQESCYIAGITW